MAYSPWALDDSETYHTYGSWQSFLLASSISSKWSKSITIRPVYCFTLSSSFTPDFLVFSVAEILAAGSSFLFRKFLFTLFFSARILFRLGIYLAPRRTNSVRAISLCIISSLRVSSHLSSLLFPSVFGGQTLLNKVTLMALGSNFGRFKPSFSVITGKRKRLLGRKINS